MHRVTTLLALAAVLAACGAEAPSDGAGNTNAGHAGSGAGASGSNSAGSFGNSVVDAAVGGGSGTSSLPMTDGCASVSVDANVEVKPGNVLVVFDQSLTMNDAWTDPAGGSSPKFLAAGKALLDAITPIVGQVNLGAIFFPTTAATNLLDLCTADVAPFTTAPPQIAVASGATFITMWDQHFAPPWSTLLGTPLNKALAQAVAAASDPALVGETAVVIFTDGQWTCEDGSEKTSVEALLARGVKTYVVGLPGAAGTPGLDTLAIAGGTAAAGCAANCFLLPSNTAELQAQLSTIVMETAGFESCTFTIQGRIVNKELACSGGKVTIDSTTPVACDPTNGFTIDDETHITFQGASCDTLKMSAGTLDAQFPCDVVVVD